MTTHTPSPQPDAEPMLTRRRRFLGYLIAGPTLVAAAKYTEAEFAAPEAEALPSPPQQAELADLNDIAAAAAAPTSNLITVQINKDGTASFALPRTEVGQGITTSTAMLIAEELNLSPDKVRVTLADARPELVFNQMTGGSTTTTSTFTPIRVAAALAKARLLQAAAIELGDTVTNLTAKAGEITSVSGKKITFGQLAEKAASVQTQAVSVALKPQSEFKVIGKPQTRLDAKAIVTGRKKFAMDLNVPNAKPAMVHRAPTINGKVQSVANLDQVKAMPGITDVVVISTGVAVRGNTFGQCIDAVRALRVNWGPGSVDGESDETVLQKLKAAQPALTSPKTPLAKTLDGDFTFYFASNSALETGSAVADVRADRAEIWTSVKMPIVTQEEIAQQLGLPVPAVKVHVTEGGGSFGRRLFHDAASEAAEISQKIRKPVKLMWHRTDDARHGRAHPMSVSRVRISYTDTDVVGYEQRHTSGATDLSHGVGEIFTAMAGKFPGSNGNTAQSFFDASQAVPYNFGLVTQKLNEIFEYNTFHTGSMRNVYSPNVVCARELMVDQLAGKLGKDPYKFRREAFKTDRARAVLDKVAETGRWGRPMPAGTAQGIAFHAEYHGVNAVLVEIDCRPQTVNRKIPHAVTGPRVTKVVMAVDVGLPVNPRGLEAQMMGGIMDGIAITLTSSLHFKDGLPLEGSWDDYFYTRQWNTPPELKVIVMPPTTGSPGGAGELAVAPSMAAVACAYGRATGSMPTSFPINHGTLSFDPKPRVPPIPQSPVDGLKYTY